MTRSNRHDARARRVLRRISEAISDSTMAREIDEPIDSALNEYLAMHEVPTQAAEFLAATADLLCVLYRQTAIGIELSPDMARDEAVHLLESGYHGTYADGYQGALMDVANPGHLSPADVWRELACIVKARRRARRMEGLQAAFLGGLDWGTRLAMTEILMARCRPLLPAPIQSLPCELVVDEVLSLLRSEQASDAQLQHILKGAWHG